MSGNRKGKSRHRCRHAETTKTSWQETEQTVRQTGKMVSAYWYEGTGTAQVLALMKADSHKLGETISSQREGYESRDGG